MIIQRVVLDNFGSFRGRTELDLAPKGHKNITLIVGHGGAGKTTVGKAIRWALYNRPFHGNGKGYQENGFGEITDPEYGNEEILKLFFREGGGGQSDKPPTESSMSVQLTIQPSESVKAAMIAHGLKFGAYELERSATVNKIVPKSKDVILSPLSLKGPDQREVPGDPEGIVDEFFLPASTSTFFMFHGDRIRDLTNQIDQPVTNAIRQILDVTAVKNAEIDLDKVTSRFSRRISATSKDEDIRDKKQKNADSLKEQEEKEEKRLQDKREAFNSAKAELDGLVKEQRELLDIAGLLGQHDTLAGKRDTLRGQLEAIDESIRLKLDEFPREALYHLLHKRAYEFREVDRHNKEHEKEIERLKTKRAQVEELKPGQKCPVCKQPYPSHMVNERQREVQELDSKIDFEKKAIQPLRPEYEDLMRSVMSLETSRYDPKELLERRYNLRNQRTDIENEINEIKKGLGSHTDATVRKRAEKVAQDVREKSYQLGTMDTSIKELEGTIQTLRDARKKTEREIADLAGSGAKKLKAYFDLSSKLGTVFSECVEELADQKRQEIATEAGKMLMSVTLKRPLFSAKTPILVDKDFHVQPINFNGDPLSLRDEASSEKSLLSLSFIYGLLKASERDAPVILDTFFGNLDPNQITRITSQLSKFGTQVVLMTTLTEFEDLRTRADPEFWAKVARFIFLHDSPKTNFVTEHKVFNDLEDAEGEAKAQEREFAKDRVVVST